MKRIIVVFVLLLFALTATGQRLPVRPAERPLMPMEAYILVDSHHIPVIIDGQMQVITPVRFGHLQTLPDMGDSTEWMLVQLSEVILH
jgi:hypothetical protein